jgi:hypothetical protein
MSDAKSAAKSGVTMDHNSKPRTVKIVWDSGYLHLDIHDRSDLDLALQTFDKVFKDLLDEVSHKLEQPQRCAEGE